MVKNIVGICPICNKNPLDQKIGKCWTCYKKEVEEMERNSMKLETCEIKGCTETRNLIRYGQGSRCPYHISQLPVIQEAVKKIQSGFNFGKGVTSPQMVKRLETNKTLVSLLGLSGIVEYHKKGKMNIYTRFKGLPKPPTSMRVVENKTVGMFERLQELQKENKELWDKVDTLKREIEQKNSKEVVDVNPCKLLINEIERRHQQEIVQLKAKLFDIIEER